MIIRVVRQPLSAVDAQWLAVGLYEKNGETGSELLGTSAEPIYARLVEEKEFKGSLGEMTPLFGLSGFAAPSVMLLGLGSRAKFDARTAFQAGVTLGKRLASKPRESVAVSLNAALAGDVAAVVPALVEGLVVGTQGPGLRKSESNRQEFGRLDLIVDPGVAEDVVTGVQALAARGEVVGRAMNLARAMVNTPPSEKAPAAFAEWIRRKAEEEGVGVEVWGEDRIRAERFGGLIGVAAGSSQPPAFVVLEYLKGGDAPTTALVGKGVTFDSGGLSLKPSASMEDMKSDMTGAAVVTAAILAAARLKLPINVRGYLPLTENMTGGAAMKLGDVLTMRNGKTVEVLNTDAEGRLILADALAYAAESKPARMVDLATLTGACIVALGVKTAGLFSNDEALSRTILDASARSGERTWAMPLDDDFKDALKSNVADLKNVGGKWGGAITAAKFLEEFVGSIPWAHLDVAGPSWNDGEGSSRDAGGTGCFVRTLTNLMDSLA